MKLRTTLLGARKSVAKLQGLMRGRLQRKRFTPDVHVYRQQLAEAEAQRAAAAETQRRLEEDRLHRSLVRDDPIMARYGLYDPATEHVKGAMPPDALALYLASSAGGKRLGATKRRRLPKEPPSPGLAGLEPKAGLAQAAAEAALAAADPRNK